MQRAFDLCNSHRREIGEIRTCFSARPDTAGSGAERSFGDSTPTDMSTLLAPFAAALRDRATSRWPSGIVVGTDGRAASIPAIDAAHRLAGDAPFAVVSVLADTTARDLRDNPAGEGRSADDQRTLVEAQLHDVLGDSADTWIDVRRGYPPAVLAAFADSRR